MTRRSGTEGVYTFSKPKSYVFVVNNLGKIALGLLIFMIAIVFIKFNDTVSLFRSIHTILFLSLLIYLTERFLKKFAYKVTLDFGSQNIRFFMNRSKDFIEVSFDDIKNLRVNGYITFSYGNKKILYSGAPSEDILTCLYRIRRSDWGLLCSVLGPSKELRDVLR